MACRRAAPAAVFFIHPTSYLDRAHWNAPLDDAEANGRAALFLRGQASVFNEAGQVWAPRYRQATFGAFLTSQADAEKALDLAYRDVAAAFDEFLKEIGPDRPIILAGHSQGALHLDAPAARASRGQAAREAHRRGLRDRLADLEDRRPSRARPARMHDAPIRPAASCRGRATPSPPIPRCCSMSSTRPRLRRQRARGTAPLVCTNPLTGTPNGAAPATANLGTLVARPTSRQAR